MGDFRMPYYNFDLVIGEECKNQGGLILEDLDVASDRAEQLAREKGTTLEEEVRQWLSDFGDGKWKLPSPEPKK